MKTKSQPRKKKSHPLPAEQSSASENRQGLLIVAIGASAGGIEAFTELLKNLPADTGMAFVLVQHLDPKHHSMLTEVVARQTKMPVQEAAHGMHVQANHVYVIPPNAIMSISDHTLQLSPRPETGGQMTIDRFMRSLAEVQGNRAIGVILSGYGTDGTLGMCEIQAQGGVTFAQEDAKFDGMPRSAIAAGYVDYVLPPKGIARELTRIAGHPYIAAAEPADVEVTSAADSGLGAILRTLRQSTNTDFTQYRQTTILRRIHRRMVVHKIDRIRDYAKFVQANPGEAKALYRDMLINVTSFFRTPQIFEALKTVVFPRILGSKEPDQAVRIWTAGCASGEETYSLAIALLEFLGSRASTVPIQLFGTDLSEAGIVKARMGVYPENIQEDVSPERLHRFFTKSENMYRISKNIRDMCIFAQHNVLDDPPFSQMDIVTCRNLLIYLEPPAQSRALSLFHYALRSGGFLVLGSSEGVVTASHLFAVEDRTAKIFSKKGLPARQLVTFSVHRRPERGEQRQPLPGPQRPPAALNYAEAQKEFDRRLLAHYPPAAAFINEDLEIIHTRGNIGQYLKLAPGRVSLSILKMAREGLLMDLRNAIAQAKKGEASVRRENVVVKTGNGNGHSAAEQVRVVNLEVTPVRIGKFEEQYFMVIFEDVPPKSAGKKSRGTRRTAELQSGRIVKLEQELSATKEYLQSVIETQEAMNEELQAANEEILSSNEELQSTNEELETAKEELQSANEELSTVNDELRERNAEISRAHDDLTNLLVNAELASVMVASDLTIRRFTPPAQKIFGLIPADVGRPVLNINTPLEIPNFQQTLAQAMSGGAITAVEIPDRSGGLYLVRISPYRLADRKIEGALVTAVPIKSAPRSKDAADS